MTSRPLPIITLDYARKSALAFFALLMFLYLFVMPEVWQRQFDDYYFEPMLLTLLFALMLGAWQRAVNRSARMFFGLVCAAFSCWILVRIFMVALPDQAVDHLDLERDAIFQLFFAIFVAIIELRLDTRGDDQWILRRVSPAVGSALLVCAIFGYFAIIPAVAADEPYTWLLTLHAGFDAYIGLRFLIAAFQADEKTWKTIYALFGAAFVLITWADILLMLFESGVITYVPGSILNVTWYLWYPLLFIASGVVPVGAEKSLDAPKFADELPNTNGLLFFGIALPLIHAVGYAAGWLTPAARQLRDVFVATWLLVIVVVLFGLYQFIHRRLNMMERRRAAAEVKAGQFEEQLNRELRIRSLGRLSTGLAHDFGNTMTALEMHATAAEKRMELGDSAEAEFDGVRKSVRYAKKMVAQLKLFGAPQERVETRVLALSEEVKKTLDLIMPSLKMQTKIELRGGESDSFVRAEPAMVHQVVTNYVYNAIYAIGDDGLIEVSIDEHHVSGLCRSCGELLNGRFALLSVCDSGPGVSDLVAEHVFEPLVTTKPTGLGSGLGLSSVHGIMHKIGGHVGLMNGSLGGANFVAYFPLSK